MPPTSTLMKKTMKSLSRMKNSDVGSIDHMEIHPAKNSKGGRAFLTKTFRNRPPAAQAAMDQGGPYTPPPQPDEVQHQDANDMASHVASTFGANPPENDGDADED